jgi:hypothetical protein
VAADPEKRADTSAETILQVLETLSAESRRRQAQGLRGRLRAKRIFLALATIAVLVFGALSILVMSGEIHLRVLHASVSTASDSGTSPGSSVADEPARRPLRPAASQATVGSRPILTTAPSVERKATPASAMLLRLTAVRGPSWIEARRGGPTGAALYAGTLSQGSLLRLRGRRVWVRFGALGNLDILLDGKPVRLLHTGTVEAVFTPKGVSAR